MATIDEEFGRAQEFECQTCNAEFGVEYYICPECGGFSVERPW